MESALANAEDAIIRYIKGSVRLPRPQEVEEKRVHFVARELLNVRSYWSTNQLKMR